MSVGEPLFLYRGVTMAIFHSFGIVLVSMHLLNSFVSGIARVLCAALRIFAGIPEIPGPQSVSSFDRSLSTITAVVL
jgi:hypothetical protein